MKKLTTISLFIFFTVVVAIFVSGLLYYQKNKANSVGLNGYSNTSIGVSTDSAAFQPNAGEASVTTQGAQTGANQLSLAEIAKHNSASDCWSIVNGKVYNVTALISGHTGGSAAIIAGCGKDASQAFNTRGTNGPHPERAAIKLDEYYVGVVGAEINTSVKTNLSPATGTNSSLAPTATAGTVSLSMTEIAKHNTTADCWLLINSKVYSVSSFISAHPGGSGTIIPNCGKDSTQAFNTKGGKSSHSNAAIAMLADYYIGNFNQEISQQQVQASVQQTNAVAPKVKADEEWEDESNDD